MKWRLDLAVTDLGPTKLKNIAEPIRVYSLDVGMPTQAKPSSAPAPEKSAPPRLSMVVLPFANIGGNPEQEHFVAITLNQCSSFTEAAKQSRDRRRLTFPWIASSLRSSQ